MAETLREPVAAGRRSAPTRSGSWNSKKYGRKTLILIVPCVPARMRTVPSVPAAVDALFLFTDPTGALAIQKFWHARHG